MRSIKKKFPAAEIDFLLSREYTDVIRFNPYITSILELDKKKSPTGLIKELSYKKYDVVIDLQNNIRSRRLTKSFNSRVVRFKKPSIKKLLLVKLKINLLRANKSIPELYAETFPEVQLDSEGLDFYFQENSETDKKGKKIVGLCPGARHYTKMWPAQFYIDLGNKLVKNGYQVHLLGGGADIKVCESISAEIKNSINKCTDNNLFDTAGTIKECDVIVCNDSGLMHLSAALKIPLITIFGSTVKEFGFSPYKTVSLVLENNSLSCRPCTHIGRNNCPKKHFNCMNSITPDFVFNQLQKFLRGTSNSVII